MLPNPEGIIANFDCPSRSLSSSCVAVVLSVRSSVCSDVSLHPALGPSVLPYVVVGGARKLEQHASPASFGHRQARVPPSEGSHGQGVKPTGCEMVEEVWLVLRRHPPALVVQLIQDVNTHTRPTHTHTTHDKQTESGDDATSERETEAHRVRGGWRLEHHPGKGLDILKADTEHPTTQPPHTANSIPPQAGMEAGLTQRSPHPGAQRHGISASREPPARQQPNAHTHTHTHTYTHTHARRRGEGVSQQAGPHGWQNPDGRWCERRRKTGQKASRRR